MFHGLLEFKEQYGHFKVPQGYMCHDKNLFYWVRNQRTAYRNTCLGEKPGLSQDRIDKLLAVGFDFGHRQIGGIPCETTTATLPGRGDSRSRSSSDMELDQAEERDGDEDYSLEDDETTASTSLDAASENVASLSLSSSSALSFIWDDMFDGLSRYQRKFGHCRVPANQKHHGRLLSEWIETQQELFQQSKLSKDRIAKLQSIGLDLHQPRRERRPDKTDAQHVVRKRCSSYESQRSTKVVDDTNNGCSSSEDELPQDERQSHSSALTVFDDLWNRMYQGLVQFYKKHHHFRVPQKLDVNGNSLSQWVYVQRNMFRNKILSPERIAKLRAIGFDFDGLKKGEAQSRQTLGTMEADDDAGEADKSYLEDGDDDDDDDDDRMKDAESESISDYEQSQTDGRSRAASSRPDSARLPPTVQTSAPDDEHWNRMYHHLVQFRDKYHDSEFLAQWMNEQRMLLQRNHLSPERIAKLRNIGFSFRGNDRNLLRGDDNYVAGAVQPQENGNGDADDEEENSIKDMDVDSDATDELLQTAERFQARAPADTTSSYSNMNSSKKSRLFSASSTSNEPQLLDEEEEDFYRLEQTFLKQLDEEIYAAQEADFLNRLDCEIHEAELTEQERALTQASDHCASGGPLMRVTKKFPKFMPGTSIPFITQHNIDTEILPAIQKKMQRRGASIPQLSVTLKSCAEDDQDSVVLVARGAQKVALVEIHKHLLNWHLNRVRAYNYSLLQESGIEIFVEVVYNGILGAVLEGFVKGDKRGVLMSNLKPDGPLAHALGANIFAYGACVLQVDGSCCESLADFKEALKRVNGRKLALDLVVSNEADLSGVQSACLRKSPRRLDGKPLSCIYPFASERAIAEQSICASTLEPRSTQENTIHGELSASIAGPNACEPGNAQKYDSEREIAAPSPKPIASGDAQENDRQRETAALLPKPCASEPVDTQEHALASEPGGALENSLQEQFSTTAPSPTEPRYTEENDRQAEIATATGAVVEGRLVAAVASKSAELPDETEYAKLREELLANGIELAIEISTSEKLGAQLKYHDNKLGGISIALNSNKGALARSLGLHIFDKGACLLQANGCACLSIADVKKKISQGTSISIDLCINQEADLSGLKLSCLRKPPRRRDGKPLTFPEIDDCCPIRDDGKFNSTMEGTNVPHGSRNLHNAFDAGSARHQIRIDPSVCDSPKTDKTGHKVSPGPIHAVNSCQSSANNSSCGAKFVAELLTPPVSDSPIQSADTFGVEKASPDCSKVTSSTSKQDHAETIQSYNHFMKKYKDAAMIEFGNTGIHLKFVIGRMWDKHRNLPSLGLKCNDDCRCVFHLHELGESVINDQLARVRMSEKKTKPIQWNNLLNLKEGDTPVGFMKNFSKKFLPLLKDKFPEEAPPILLERLIRMWDKHRSLLNFGLKCNDSCDCEEGWSLVFGEGDPDKTGRSEALLRGKKRHYSSETPPESIEFDASNSTKRQRKDIARESGNHSSPNVKIFAVQIAQNANEEESNLCNKDGGSFEFAGCLPRKARKAIEPTQISTLAIRQREAERANSNSQELTNSPAEFTAPLPRKIRRGSENDEPRSLVSHVAGTRQHEELLCFKTDQPLGFFCVTEAASGKCKVSSVYPKGQAAGRVQSETQVVGAVIGEVRHDVKSHLDLKEVYDRARTQKCTLTLCVKKPSAMVSSSCQPDKMWSKSGCWRGKESFGWAGGAQRVSSLNSYIMQHRKSVAKDSSSIDYKGHAQLLTSNTVAARKHIVSDDCNQACNAVASTIATTGTDTTELRNSTPEWVKIVSRKPINVSFRPKSILSTGERLAHQDKTARIRFAESIEERRYAVGSRTTEFLMIPNGGSSLMNLFPKPKVVLDLSLNDAVAKGQVQTVVQLLEAGAAAELSTRNLQPLRDGLKDAREELTKNGWAAGDAVVKSNGKKDKLLKIYMTSDYAVTTTKSLKNWVSFEILIEGVVGIPVHDFPHVEGSPNYVYAEPVAILDKAKPEPLAAPPKSPLSASVTFPVASPYRMRHNSIMEAGRILQINVLLGGENGPDRLLGSAWVPMSHLYNRCSQNSEKWYQEDVDVRPEGGSSLESSCKVKIRARRQEPDKLWLKKKRGDEASRIQSILDWIERFNEDLDEDERQHCHLTANVRVGGLSLLHAAVFLEDYGLVDALLSRGADPSAKSQRAGSALSLALKMAEGQVEKTSGGASVDEDVWRHARRSRLEDITELLRKYGRLRDGGNDDIFVPGLSDLENMENGSDTDNEMQKYDKIDLPLQKKGTMPLSEPEANAEAYRIIAEPEFDGLDDERPNGLHQNTRKNDPTHPTERNLLPDHAGETGEAGVMRNILPHLQAHWLEIPKVKKCNYFNKNECRYGLKCNNWHVQDPLGDNLSKVCTKLAKRASGHHFTKCTRFRESYDKNGKLWHTAGYRDDEHKVIFYAERGRRGKQNAQGVWWYPSQDDADESLRKVITISAMIHRENENHRTQHKK